MLLFLLRRIGAGLVLVIVVASITFFLMALTGGNVGRQLLGPLATPDQVALKNEQLGQDVPVFQRWLAWLAQAAQGQLGDSWASGQSVVTAIGDRLPVTVSIVVGGLLISAVVAIVIGIAAAVRGGWLDRVAQVFSVLGYAVPNFLFALVLSFGLAVQLQLFPAIGYTPFADSPTAWLLSITLPSIALAIGAIGATAQQVRGAMIDVLRNDYVRTLRSRGLPTGSVLFRHALRNAAPPALTILGLQVIGLVGGAVVIERVFGLQGIGSAVLSSSSSGDQPMVLGIVVVMVLLIVVVNLLMDVAYGWLNPKVRVA